MNPRRKDAWGSAGEVTARTKRLRTRTEALQTLANRSAWDAKVHNEASLAEQGIGGVGIFVEGSRFTTDPIKIKKYTLR